MERHRLRTHHDTGRLARLTLVPGLAQKIREKRRTALATKTRPAPWDAFQRHDPDVSGVGRASVSRSGVSRLKSVANRKPADNDNRDRLRRQILSHAGRALYRSRYRFWRLHPGDLATDILVFLSTNVYEA